MNRALKSREIRAECYGLSIDIRNCNATDIAEEFKGVNFDLIIFFRVNRAYDSLRKNESNACKLEYVIQGRCMGDITHSQQALVL